MRRLKTPNASMFYLNSATLLLLVCLLIFLYSFAPHFMGWMLIAFSLVYLYFAKNLTVLLICFFNISCGTAFDYYLSVNRWVFGFYRGDGITVDFLAFVFILFFILIVAVDSFSNLDRGKGVLFKAKVPEISVLLFYPCALLVLWCCFFLLNNSGNIFKSNFSLDNLEKYSFLEYFSVVIFMMLSSAKTGRKIKIAYFLSLIFIALLMLASYRMVAIVVILSVFAYKFNGVYVSRKLMFLLWLLGYTLFGMINLLRSDSDITLGLFLGYKDFGYLDNTFTGVIETSLIYTAIMKDIGFYESFLELIGTIAPLPSSLIPDYMVYYSDLASKYSNRIPGGGVVSGFIIYFYFIFLPIILTYLFFAFTKGGKNIFFGMLSLISLITVSRWYLYGPYSLFKFVGVLFLFYLINYFFKVYQYRNSRRRLC